MLEDLQIQFFLYTILFTLAACFSVLCSAQLSMCLTCRAFKHNYMYTHTHTHTHTEEMDVHKLCRICTNTRASYSSGSERVRVQPSQHYQIPFFASNVHMYCMRCSECESVSAVFVYVYVYLCTVCACVCVQE